MSEILGVFRGLRVRGSEVCVRIDSLGIVACNLSPRDICERIAWLAEGSEPAYI